MAAGMAKQRVVPNRIGAPVNGVQPPGPHRMAKRFLRVAELLQLPDGDNAVLRPRDRGQPMVTSSFCVHLDY